MTRSAADRVQTVGLCFLATVLVVGCKRLEGQGIQKRIEKGTLPEPTATIDLGAGVKIEMVYIKPGRFMMGSDYWSAAPAERPSHEVVITKGFDLGRYELTQAQYERVTGDDPSGFKRADRPVECVSWNHAVAFCRKLSELTGKSFRLPTEAEWEYACRAGSTGRYCFGNDVNELDEYAWNMDNSGRHTHPVGQKRPNAWGFCDTLGNVYEWCADWYDRDYYGKSPREDPRGPAKGLGRVVRGGAYGNGYVVCTSANRGWLDPASGGNNFGFRVAMSAAR